MLFIRKISIRSILKTVCGVRMSDEGIIVLFSRNPDYCRIVKNSLFNYVVITFFGKPVYGYNEFFERHGSDDCVSFLKKLKIK